MGYRIGSDVLASGMGHPLALVVAAVLGLASAVLNWSVYAAEYKDGSADTEQLDAYRDSATATQLANRDVLAGWQWVATLSSRTCRSCIAMHGSIHDIDEPGPLDHQQGRCSRAPVTKRWSDINPRLAGISEPPGMVQPGDGEAWLRKQSPEVQDKILGKRGAEAWRNGQWPASQ